jgi:tetratricopeptide (TPR) repeat protein
MSVGQQDFQSLVLSCNKDGMDALRKGQHKAAFEQFKYAEAILIASQAEGDNTSLLAVTCNNLGCYFKKVGKLHGALSYLRRALKMEVELNTHEVTLAGTHLNICAILSKLEKHDKAVQHAVCALDLINQLVAKSDPDNVSQDDYSVLAIAYHNVAVERDFLQQYEKAAAAFQQGYQVAKRCLGEDHPLSITLGKNCDAVLQKSQKLSKNGLSSSGAGGTRSFMRDPLRDSPLPDINSGISRYSEAAMPMSGGNFYTKEESAFTNFASSALSMDTGATPKEGTPQQKKTGESVSFPPIQSPPQAKAALDNIPRDLVAPSFQDTLNYRDGAPNDQILSPTVRMQHKTPFAQALDAHPAALMDIIDADTSQHSLGGARTAPNDYRPNRVIKGATRTSRVVRRTGMFNSTKHRDQVMTNALQAKSAPERSHYVQKVAAEKIQRVWRAWFKYSGDIGKHEARFWYCQENSDWMTTTWICATMIQAKWRSYHVRRLKFDKGALAIQRHIRGHLVRKVLRKHSAATTIQRHVIGMLTRRQLRKLHMAAVKMQALVRGGQARKRVREKRRFMNKIAITIQCRVRCMIAKRVVSEKRSIRDRDRMRVRAAVDIQRFWRGFVGRKAAALRKQQYAEDLVKHKAATRIQALVRRDNASRRVDNIRTDRLRQMNKAATFLRKMWLGARTRKHYRALLTEFRAHEGHIITIQRYARGFVVRLRMWREAIRAEEELWAALEIQRVLRGYWGRVRWENAYEKVWEREVGAAKIQRNIRGWLARTRVNRSRRKIARAEFERARRRFRSAQRIQALARGVQVRRVVNARRIRVVRAAVCIQRIARGHALRKRLWRQVIDQKATMLGTVARGFLVRNRRFHLVAKVIFIQRHVRAWQKKPQEFRRQAFLNMRVRKDKAAKIQSAFRKHSEKKEVQRIKQEDDELDKTQPLGT